MTLEQAYFIAQIFVGVGFNGVTGEVLKKWCLGRDSNSHSVARTGF